MKKKRTSFVIKKWSKDDDDTLREMYNNPNIKIKEIQIILNRSEASIFGRAHVLGLKKVSFSNMEAEDENKICRRCGKSKPYDDFYKNKSLKDGLNSWCKDCSKEAKNKYLLKEAEKKIENDLSDKEKFIKELEGQLFICTKCNRELDIYNFPIVKKYNKYKKEARCKICKNKANNEYKYKKLKTLGHI